MPSGATAQYSSLLFKLPAEIRITIYEFLDYPPIHNDQCRGLVLSCRLIKRECEHVAARKARAWLLSYKQEILPQCQLGIRLLLPSITRAPVRTHANFTTIRRLTLVLPGHWVRNIAFQRASFFKELHYLRPVFGLWLDSLTLYFSGPLDVGSGSGSELMDCNIDSGLRRLFFILESSFTYGHDPVGQKQEKKVNKYGWTFRHWNPQPVFIKKLVLCWDLTEKSLTTNDMVRLDGHCWKRPTQECVGSRYHRVVSDGALLGEESRESFCRFRPCETEDRAARPRREHRKACYKCGNGAWSYHRYIRGLPAEGDKRWL